MSHQMTSPSSTTPKDHPSISTESLPILPLGSSQASTAKATISRPSSVLNMSFLTKPNVRRDLSLSDKPNNLPFASAAFAELHRRRASSAKAPMRAISPTPPLPLKKAAMQPLPPAPPPLPPKPEMSYFPDGSRTRTSSITTPSGVVTSFAGFDIDATAVAASWLSFSPPSPPLSTKRSSGRVSVLTKSVKSKMLKRMTISTFPVRQPSSDQRQRKSKSNISARRMAHLISRKRSTLGFPYSDAKSHDNQGANRFSYSEHDGDDDSSSPVLYVNSPTAADADDESEAIVHYAEKATFRRPTVVQCQPGARKVAIQDVLKTGLPPLLPLELELELCGRPTVLTEPEKETAAINLAAEVDAGEDGDAESEGFDAEAEERLERRLAEDRLLEQRLVDRSDRTLATADQRATEKPWSDVILSDSISDHHLAWRTERATDEQGAVAKKTMRRRGSAMSELDELVRQSLFIGPDSIDYTNGVTCDGDMLFSPDLFGGGGGGGGGGRQKRKVSFSRPPNVDVALARKQVAWLRLGTPYPFFNEERSTIMAEEASCDGVEEIMEVAAPEEQWDVNRFAGRRSPIEGDKARKVLGLMKADEMLGLD